MERFYVDSSDNISTESSDCSESSEEIIETTNENPIDVTAEVESESAVDTGDNTEFEPLDISDAALDSNEGSGDQDVLQECQNGLTDDEIAAAKLEENIADSPPSFSDALNNAELFNKNEFGDYTYLENEHGKNAFGSLELTDDPHRDPEAQRTVGGEDRLPDDDGGHLIGARFDGSGGYENLDAQNSNVNRSGYKRMENEWADSLKEGDKVFANVETYKRDGSERPDAYMGYSITENSDGSRSWDAFSFQNESAEMQEQWEKEIEELTDDVENDT